MEMEDVEALLLDDRGDLVRKVEAERYPRHGIVDRDGDRGANPVEARSVEINVGPARRREDASFVPEAAELARQVTNVIVYTSW